MAYQIAFDLEENATQDFLRQVIDYLPEPVAKNEGDMETDDKTVSLKISIKVNCIKFRNFKYYTYILIY